MDGIGDGKAPAACARLLTPLHLWRSAGVLDAGCAYVPDPAAEHEPCDYQADDGCRQAARLPEERIQAEAEALSKVI